MKHRSMNKLLSEFRELLSETDPDAASGLKPGLSRESVVDLLDRLPFSITPEAVELYTWADGVDDKPLELLPGSYFVSLKSAINTFEQLAPFREEFEEVFPQPYRDSFCFLSDFSDGGYAFGAYESAAKGAIVDLVIHDEWQLAFPSLEKLIETAIECRKRGVFGSDGDVDFELFYLIGRELNPSMKAWEGES